MKHNIKFLGILLVFLIINITAISCIEKSTEKRFLKKSHKAHQDEAGKYLS